MEICPFCAQFFQADKRTDDKRDTTNEANIRSSLTCGCD